MKESLQFRGTHGWRLSVFNFTRSHVWSRTRRWVVTARCLWWGRSVSLCVFLAIVCHLWSAGGIKTHNTHSVIEEWERQGPPQKRKRHCVVFIWFMWVTQYRPLNCTPLGLTRIEKSIYLHTHTRVKCRCLRNTTKKLKDRHTHTQSHQSNKSMFWWRWGPNTHRGDWRDTTAPWTHSQLTSLTQRQKRRRQVNPGHRLMMLVRQYIQYTQPLQWVSPNSWY